jgi:hypothetical protein
MVARGTLGLITTVSMIYIAWHTVRLEHLPPFVIRWLPKVN